MSSWRTVGSRAWAGHGWTARETISIDGRVVIPGLIDSHMHLESTLLTPAELSRLIVPMGTTTVISDSHEVGNVLGIPGIDRLARAAEGLPLDLYFMARRASPRRVGRMPARSSGPKASASYWAGRMSSGWPR